MAIISVAGRTAATAAAANAAAAQLWNPHASSRPKLKEIHVAITTAGATHIALRRSSARGTPTSTATPTAPNSSQNDLVAVAGLLDLAFSAQPTLIAGPALWQFPLPAAAGAAVIKGFPDSLVIPPLSGLVLTTPVGVAFPISDVTFVWDE